MESLRILAITAHPDDVDFGASATVSTWTKAGHEVSYVLVTSGDAGGFDDRPREQIVAERRAEQLAAAKKVGVSDVKFLEGYRDGYVEPSAELVKDLVREIRRVRPHRILMLSPERNWRAIGQSHPDHLAVGEATIRAIYPASENPFAFPDLLQEEGLQDWRVEEVWLQADPRPNHAVLVDEELFQIKLDAISVHFSQLPDPSKVADRLRERSQLAAQQVLGDKAAAGAMAEVFRVEYLHGLPAREDVACVSEGLSDGVIEPAQIRADTL